MSWTAYHLHYHEDRDRALRLWARPLVAELFAAGLVDRFFFIRYGLGGPHVRLRLRGVDESAAESLDRLVRRRADSFFAEHPSLEALPEEKVRAMTEALAEDDPSGDSTIRPDNSLAVQPFLPETGRFGGAEQLEHSLDFFALSSLEALRWLDENPQAGPGRRLSHGFRLFARQALGFASSLEELRQILDYVADLWSGASEALRERADSAFENQRADFARLLDAELAASLLEDPADQPPLLDASRRLAAATAELPRERWYRLVTSQIHMTANRLGLSNPEEVYLGRLMVRALADREAGSEVFDAAVANLEPARRAAEDGRIFECNLPPLLAANPETATRFASRPKGDAP